MLNRGFIDNDAEENDDDDDDDEVRQEYRVVQYDSFTSTSDSYSESHESDSNDEDDDEDGDEEELQDGEREDEDNNNNNDNDGSDDVVDEIVFSSRKRHLSKPKKIEVKQKKDKVNKAEGIVTHASGKMNKKKHNHKYLPAKKSVFHEKSHHDHTHQKEKNNIHDDDDEIEGEEHEFEDMEFVEEKKVIPTHGKVTEIDTTDDELNQNIKLNKTKNRKKSKSNKKRIVLHDSSSSEHEV